jgi:16S rRNA (cytosine1402-N4)-methyltransferase
MPTGEPIHVSVMPDEVIEWLRPEAGQVFVDGTFGAGGHTRRLAERVGAAGRVIALDRDPQAITSGQLRFGGLPVDLVHADYRDIPSVLTDRQREKVDGILLDLGMSSDQLADAQRGFSFQGDGELDLRFDPTIGAPAWELVEELSAEQLADVIYQYGEERFSRRIARRIVERREKQRIRSTSQLAELVRSCVPRSRNHAIDPATRTFQALRIAVNDELGALEDALRFAPDVLKPGGRIAVISFHSLEDRRVKHAFRDDPRYVVLTRKPVRPYEIEIQRNSRSRSAKMRVAERAAISS